MFLELNYDLIKMRNEAFLREARQDRLAKSLLSDQPSTMRIWLHHAGTLLVTVGLRHSGIVYFLSFVRVHLIEEFAIIVV